MRAPRTASTQPEPSHEDATPHRSTWRRWYYAAHRVVTAHIPNPRQAQGEVVTLERRVVEAAAAAGSHARLATHAEVRPSPIEF
jgi:hypothetical protein